MDSMKIKVCGMCRPENIRRVEALDIDYIGFVFYRASPRCVSGRDDECLDAIRRCTKRTVGVFVNETVENMLATAARYRLDGLQLHGDESPGTGAALRKSGYFILKAFPVTSAEDVGKAGNYCSDGADYFLFDTRCAGYGGSGKRFDWSLLERYTGHVPFMLSGGLTPDSIHDIRLLKHFRFAGIDLNSGFEISPALKDVGKLKRFIDEVRKI
jgi:phosphoribosylanthranilate isomerase